MHSFLLSCLRRPLDQSYAAGLIVYTYLLPGNPVSHGDQNFFHVERLNRIRIGKISSLPISISALKTSLLKLLNSE